MTRSPRDWDVAGNGADAWVGDSLRDALAKIGTVELWSNGGVHYASRDVATGALTIHDQVVYNAIVAQGTNALLKEER